MLVTIHQPNFLPRAKVIDKLLAADLVIHLDDVQYMPREWQNRARIRRQDGARQWLTVPVRAGGSHRLMLDRCAIDQSTPWKRKHLGTLKHVYGHSPWWSSFQDHIAPLWSSSHERLVDLCIESTERIVRALDRDFVTVRASTLQASGHATARLTELCKAVGATGYLSGTGALAYLDIDYMKNQGLRVCLQADIEETEMGSKREEWRGLSILDPLFRDGPLATASGLLRGRYVEA